MHSRHREKMMSGNEEVNTYRTTARAVGVLFIAGMIIGVVGFMLVQSILGKPDHLAAVPANSLVLGIAAILLLMTAAGDAAHGILMFPILRQRSERLAFGYFGFRIVDAVFLAIGVVFLLLQIPLGSAYLKAGAPGAVYLQTLSALSIQANLNTYNIGMAFLGIAGLLLCSMLYRARLVPRPLAVWGLVGYSVILGGSILEVVGFNLNSIHTLPGGLWEVFIGVWLIAKGFSSAAFVSEASNANTLAVPLAPQPDPTPA
jgi:hypothetical protein